jgi:hypothetical protein
MSFGWAEGREGGREGEEGRTHKHGTHEGKKRVNYLLLVLFYHILFIFIRPFFLPYPVQNFTITPKFFGGGEGGREGWVSVFCVHQREGEGMRK